MEIESLLEKIRTNIARVLVGHQDAIDLLLIALLSQGHVLIEDVPGIGKTTLAQAFARSLDLSFRRIQFTPDVLPSDVTGYHLYDLKENRMTFQEGAIMSQIILADEINRSSPKTQSSLLEVMEENQVTVDGITRPVPRPFMVLATQNPIEYAGTFPLPEAQLDRFLLRINLGYPTHSEAIAILQKHVAPVPVTQLQPVADQAAVESLQAAAAEITIGLPVMEYITRISEKTRQDESIALGISPRGSIALMRAARARACLHSRSYVLPDDIQALAMPVLLHRIVLRPEAALNTGSARQRLEQLIHSIAVPAVR